MIDPAALLRRLMKPIRHTQLHPQWLVFRGEGFIRAWGREHARRCVLDVGCADGWVRGILNPDREYVGLDYSVTARAYGTWLGLFAEGACFLFRDASFQCVTVLEVSEHVAYLDLVLREAQRVLVPGCVLFLSVPFLYPLHDAPHGYQRYTPPRLTFVSRKAGFECGSPVSRNGGFEVGTMLLAIACAGAIASALRTRRLLLLPLLGLLAPCVKVFDWLCSAIGPSELMTSGFHIEARKHDSTAHA